MRAARRSAVATAAGAARRGVIVTLAGAARRGVIVTLAGAARRGVVVTLAGAALGVVLVAIGVLAVWLAPSSAKPVFSERYFAGYFGTGDLMDIADNTVDVGTYRITYEADVLFQESTSRATLTCGLRDPNLTILRFSPSSARSVRSSANVQHIRFTGEYALPPMSFALRCQTNVAGDVRAQFSNITLTTQVGG
jgi:hypothetical protein